MPKSGPNASQTKRKARGEASDEENSSKVPNHKNTGAMKNTEATFRVKTPSRGESLGVTTRSKSVRHKTMTVHYVCGGKLKQVELKVPVIKLEEFVVEECRAISRYYKEQDATRARSKSKVPAVRNRKHVPVRVTRKNSAPFRKSGQARTTLQNKATKKERNRLQNLREERKTGGETSQSSNSPKGHRHSHHKKTGVVKDTEAAVERKPPSLGGSLGVVPRSKCVRYKTTTVHYVCGGKLKQVELKVAVIKVEDWFQELLRSASRYYK
ncbi:hypothetical protein HPB50_001346 [Hyalomma asiaticum]|uniref:Uncharacterized protein n=1 Tax=Hyalomma asiaticum TaxID=266040 RepID=A0ACB7TCQ9_HYAAI|nr:hypothetical protein HPB50_001346 [Hyalomma asiaticum]